LSPKSHKVRIYFKGEAVLPGGLSRFARAEVFRKTKMSKKKKEGQVLPFRIGLGSSKPPQPMTFDDAMDVLMDPANLPPKGWKPPPKGSKGPRKPRKKK
jgi:hypothetical protein